MNNRHNNEHITSTAVMLSRLCQEEEYQAIPMTSLLFKHLNYRNNLNKTLHNNIMKSIGALISYLTSSH